MRAKFNKYWDGLKDINRLLIVASVFDPRNKMKFAGLCFEKLYGKDSPQSKVLNDSNTAQIQLRYLVHRLSLRVIVVKSHKMELRLILSKMSMDMKGWILCTRRW